MSLPRSKLCLGQKNQSVIAVEGNNHSLFWKKEVTDMHFVGKG
jgi:hypothetical protein